jgi:hypothetical protein
VVRRREGALRAAGKRFTCGLHRVELIGLAAATSRAPGMVDLDDTLTVPLQKAHQSYAIATAAFDRPDQAGARRLDEDEVQQMRIPSRVSGDHRGPGARPGGTHQGSGVGVAMGVDADHRVDFFGQHGRSSLQAQDGTVRRRPGRGHRVAGL